MNQQVKHFLEHNLRYDTKLPFYQYEKESMLSFFSGISPSSQELDIVWESQAVLMHVWG